MKDLWKSSGWTVEIQWDREATPRRHGHKYHLKNIHRYIWHRWCKSCLNCHFLRLEVYLSNQEYSNLAAACFEPIFFSMLLFLDFSLKDTLNKTITAISQNLLKQHIFFFRMAHSSFSYHERCSQVLGKISDTSSESSVNEPNPGDAFRCKRSAEEKPWIFSDRITLLQGVGNCLMEISGDWCSPVFLKMVINH